MGMKIQRERSASDASIEEDLKDMNNTPHKRNYEFD